MRGGPAPALRCGFEEGVPVWIGGVCFPGVGGGGGDRCVGAGGFSFEVGTPLPRTGKARRPLAVTVVLGLLGTGRLRRPRRRRGLRRGEHLGLRRHKARPGGPAGLYGGCTEPGLIRGTRPSESLSGLGFPAWPAPLRPTGRTASCRHGPRPRHAWGSRGRARGERGAARAWLGLGLPAWGPPPRAQVAQLRAPGLVRGLSIPPAARQQPRGKL